MYECNICNYITKVKGNYIIHLRSKKHQYNLEQEKEREREMEKLKQKTKEKINELDEKQKEEMVINKILHMQQLLDEKDKTIQMLTDEKDKTIQILTEEKNKTINAITEEKDKTINIITKEKKSLMRQNNQILQDQQTLQQKSDEHIRLLSNMISRIQKPTANKTFAMIENYSMAKIFAPIEDMSGLTTGYKTGESFADDIVIMYRENELVGFIGEFIINYYKQTDPRYQSIFNFDASRHKYKIVEKSRKKLIISEWNDDPQGDKTQKLAIKPVLLFISEHVKKYFTGENYKKKLAKKRDVCYTMELYSDSVKFLISVESGALSTSVLHYLSSRLGITPDQQIMITQHDENHSDQLLLN